jgi:hypothetical protein
VSYSVKRNCEIKNCVTECFRLRIQETEINVICYSDPSLKRIMLRITGSKFHHLLIIVVGVVEISVLNVPPQMRSIHAGNPVLPIFAAHGIISQSALQELEPSVPVLDDTAF